MTLIERSGDGAAANAAQTEVIRLLNEEVDDGRDPRRTSWATRQILREPWPAVGRPEGGNLKGVARPSPTWRPRTSRWLL